MGVRTGVCAGDRAGLWTRAALCAGMLIVASGMQGCYERVVGARGLGASNYEIQKPYQENSKVDDWIFGERPGQDSRYRRVE